MISYIKGEFISISDDNLIIENNGIGYNIKVPLNSKCNLFKSGEKIKIFTYMYVREDAINLYGFFLRDDLMFFKLLIGVSGIGPKGALSVLSIMSSDELRLAIASGDSKSISKAPGVGVKTAQRVIIDLKDKIKFDEYIEDVNNDNHQSTQTVSVKSDAIQALVSLGYSDSESYKVVNSIEIADDMGVEEILKAALKKMAL